MKIKKIELNKNKSCYFLVPLTLIPKSYFEKAINYFAFNSHKPELTNHVFVLFDKDLLEEYEISRLQIFNCFQEIEEYGEYLLFTFKLISSFENDHKMFVKGKYSRYSEKAKQAISQHLPSKVLKTEVINGKKKQVWVMSNTYKILYPTSDCRDAIAEELGVKLEDEAEIYSIADKEEETFNINKYYNLFKQVQ